MLTVDTEIQGHNLRGHPTKRESLPFHRAKMAEQFIGNLQGKFCGANL